MSDAIITVADSKWPLFDIRYAVDFKTEYPELWSSAGGSKSDYVHEVLLDIVDNGGVALTPEQVEVLELREGWINRHRNDSTPAGVIAQVKWLAVNSSGEGFMKKSINGEVTKMHHRNAWVETKSAKAPLKDPKGGLTAAGRKFFKRTEGANLKPGVMGAANTPEKLRRKGSFLTRFFTNPSGPMKDEKGRPTRLALSAAAWGEPVPQDMSDAAKLAAKGRRLLQRYENAKNKDSKKSDEPSGYSVKAEDGKKCPPATQDIAVNIKNRQKAINSAAYGPLNPKEPNEKFWQEKADRWDVSIASAKKQKCGNCILFIRSPRILDCIESGLGNESGASWDVIEAGQIGYCEAFDFKCHAERTCDAWVVGGPTTSDNDSRKPE